MAFGCVYTLWKSMNDRFWKSKWARGAIFEKMVAVFSKQNTCCFFLLNLTCTLWKSIIGRFWKQKWAKRPPDRRVQVILLFEIGWGNWFGKFGWEIGLGNRLGKWLGKWVGNWLGKLVWEIGLGNWLGKWLICWNHFSNWFNVLVINFCVESLFRF